MDFSAGVLGASLIVSTIGSGLFLYGRKQERLPQLIGGVGLVVAPYMCASVAAIVGTCVAVVLAVWLAVRSGL